MLQLRNLARQVVGQHIQPEISVHCRLLCRLCSAFVSRICGLLRVVLDCVPFFVDNVIEGVGNFRIHTTQIAALLNLLALLTKFLHQLTHAGNSFAIGISQAVLHHLSKRAVDIPVVQKVVRHFVEQRIGIHLETPLRAIPARIGKARTHRRTIVLPTGPTSTEPDPPRHPSHPYADGHYALRPNLYLR
ncbi:unannotated protein [freshwater metagenome]|uniref:Unannotated protein n=1 Tax=freshwater metagenome TaxID=449393 RepID=A0A6J6QHX4_9ZZZZ